MLVKNQQTKLHIQKSYKKTHFDFPTPKKLDFPNKTHKTRMMNGVLHKQLLSPSFFCVLVFQFFRSAHTIQKVISGKKTRLGIKNDCSVMGHQG